MRASFLYALETSAIAALRATEQTYIVRFCQ